jgi:SAM-dependent methyltransferase
MGGLYRARRFGAWRVTGVNSCIVTNPYRLLNTFASRAMRPLTARVKRARARLAGHKQGSQAASDNPIAQANKRRDHAEELRFWRWLIKTKAGQASLFAPFDVVFGQWQRERLIELAQTLGLGESGGGRDGALGAALDVWCARQAAIEIGGGPYPALAAAPAWKSAIAVDPLARSYFEEELAPAPARRVTHLAASGEEIPLPSSSADLVIIENALDHVTDPGAVLREALRLLRPGGLLWLLVDLSDYSDEMHPHPFSLERVRTLLNSSGFECVRDRTSDHHSHPKAHGEYRALMRKPGVIATGVAVEPKSMAPTPA